MARKAIPRSIRRAARGKYLTAEALVDDSWALVTTEVFAIVGADGALARERPWHEVATGEWDDARRIMTITWVDGSKPTRLKTVNENPINFPRMFKERVDASVVYSESMPVVGGVLRGALRRTPSGELISQISSDGELVQCEQLEQQVAELEQKLWDFIGI